MNRRNFLQRTSIAASVLPSVRLGEAVTSTPTIAGQQIELRIASVGLYTTRIGLIPLQNGHPVEVSSDGSLVSDAWPSSTTILRDSSRTEPVVAGNYRIQISNNPLTLSIAAFDGHPIQSLKVDADRGTVSFAIGSELLLGLGEGGRQFDRRG